MSGPELVGVDEHRLGAVHRVGHAQRLGPALVRLQLVQQNRVALRVLHRGVSKRQELGEGIEG